MPGDQLILTAQVQRTLKGIWKFATAALVDGQEVTHADIMATPETGK